MARLIYTEVGVSMSGASDQKILKDFRSITIQQNFADHHWFELQAAASDLGVLNAKSPSDYSKELIGKKLTVTFRESTKGEDGKPAGGQVYSEFTFIITEVGISKYSGYEGDVIIRGFSPTITLENGAHYQSFSDSNLTNIFKDSIKKFMLDNYKNFNENDTIKPFFNEAIPYVAQYNESTFNFFKRLANRYGEWFYYDGKALNLGISTFEDLELKFGEDISDFNFSMKVAQLNFKKYSYDYKEASPSTFNSPSSEFTKDVNLGPYGTNAINQSSNVFSGTTLFKTDSVQTNQSGLNAETRLLTHQLGSSMLVFSANCDNPKVGLGKTVDIKLIKKVGNKEEKEDFGKYIVTSVIHRSQGHSNYQNSFEAIPNTVIAPPLYSAVEPTCEMETAIVRDNKDPDLYGRVKVQFSWQIGKDESDWMRNASPYIGFHRGVSWTPEIGDEVIVGFTDNDPDKPFVVGSVHNSKSKYTSEEKQYQNKFLGSLYTLITFLDGSDDSHGLHMRVFDKMSDPEKGAPNLINEIFSKFDNGKGTVKIKAKDEIILNAPSIILEGSNIYIRGAEKLELLSDKLISETSKEDVKVKGKKIETTADEDITMKSTQTINIEATTDLKEKGLTVAIKADTTLEAEASVKASLKGSVQLELEGGAMATLKGGIVMIN